MGRKHGMLLPAILLIIIASAAIWLRVKPPKDFVIDRPTPVAVATPDPTPSYTAPNNTGFITGSLSYPSEQIPDVLIVCANNIDTNELTCTDEQIQSSEFTYGVGYMLEVPAGDYEVYAALADQPESPKAYYTEFVTCGLSVDCPSHETIIVSVSSGETMAEIDPGDWYAQ